jgi:spermidine/putrescine transport system permease protein
MNPTTRGAWLMAPAVTLLATMLIVPLFLMFVDSFLPRGVHGGVAWPEDMGAYITSGEFLQNYARALTWTFALTLFHSIRLAVTTTVLCLLLGYPVAYTLAMHVPAKWRTFALLGIAIPLWTSFVVRTFAWVWLLRGEGVINNLLEYLGIISSPLPLLYNEGAVLLGLVYYELPFMILPVYASVERLDKRLLEAAADLGSTPVRAFWSVTWPLTRPGVLAGCALVFVPAAGQYVVANMLGGGKVALVGNIIENQFFGGKNPPFGFALTFLLSAMVLALVALAPNVAKETK